MTRHEKVVKQLEALCGFLPALGADTELVRLRLIYERGAKQMLDSDNVERIIDEAHEHVKALRKLARLLAFECRANLARHSPSKQA
jgi:hypothetical protein